MRAQPNPSRITARQFVPMALFLLGISGCGNGGGSTPPPSINLPPVASNTCSAISDFVSSLNVNLSATDPNGGALTYTITTQTTNGVVTPTSNNTGNFLYTPSTAGRHGMDRFTFTVTDSGGLTSAPATVSILNNGTVRIMPLGDSITQGVWFADSLNQCNDGSPDYGGNCPGAGVRVSYRQKFYNDLEALSPNYAVDLVGSLSNGAAAGLTQPEHEGHPGWTTSQIATGINSGWLNTNPPDIILLHIGTNSFTTSATDVDTLLDNINTWATANYPVTVFVARIIQSVNGNLNVTAFNNNVATIATNRSNVRVMPMVNQQTGAGIVYGIDTTPTCLGGGACSGDMADNLHPNPSGYTKMADKWKTDLVASGTLPTCP